jgi:hypothetical protein
MFSRWGTALKYVFYQIPSWGLLILILIGISRWIDFKYYEKIEELRAKQETARQKIEELKRSGEEACEEIKGGVDKALDGLKEGLNRALSKFKGK